MDKSDYGRKRISNNSRKHYPDKLAENLIGVHYRTIDTPNQGRKIKNYLLHV